MGAACLALTPPIAIFAGHIAITMVLAIANNVGAEL